MSGRIPPEFINDLLLNHFWESHLSSDYSIQDLDHEMIYEAVSDGVNSRRLPAIALKDDIEHILLRFQLMQGTQINNAALALFAKHHVYLPQCQMKMARFQGNDKLGDFIDNQHVSGNLFKLLNAADEFLRRHLPISSTFKSNQFKRIDKTALPVMAIREALVNALCHRDYKDEHTDFSLAIFNNRLEIWNSGLLLKQLTVQSLKELHESVLRNKLIANVFYIRDYIEKWGTGTNKIIELCSNDGLPEPDFSERTGGFLVTFWFKSPISTYVDNKDEVSNVYLSTRQKLILDIIKRYSNVSTEIILQKLGNSPARRTVQKDLQYLKNTGWIKLEGSGKNSTWVSN